MVLVNFRHFSNFGRFLCRFKILALIFRSLKCVFPKCTCLIKILKKHQLIFEATSSVYSVIDLWAYPSLGQCLIFACNQVWTLFHLGLFQWSMVRPVIYKTNQKNYTFFSTIWLNFFETSYMTLTLPACENTLYIVLNLSFAKMCNTINFFPPFMGLYSKNKRH